jgi:hypothetical protein
MPPMREKREAAIRKRLWSRLQVVLLQAVSEGHPLWCASYLELPINPDTEGGKCWRMCTCSLDQEAQID